MIIHKEKNSNPFGKVSVNTLISFILGVFSLSVGVLIGEDSLPLILALITIAGMFSCYQKNSDLFNLSGIFFFSVLIFVSIPTIVITQNLQGGVWQSNFISSLSLSQDELYRAVKWVIFGIIAFAIGNLGAKLIFKKMNSHKHEFYTAITKKTTLLISTVYVLANGIVFILTVLRFGSFSSAISYATNPAERLDVNALSSSGFNVLLLSIATISGYLISEKIRIRYFRLLLFIPSILLAIPLTSRGFLLSILLITFLSLKIRLPRNPLIFLLGAYILIVILASFLLNARGTGLSSERSYNLWRAFESFNAESTMLPTMAITLTALEDGRIGYANGYDIFLIPGLLIPRSVWIDKPLPISFRIGELLGYEGTSGTPISIFGGLFINFTPIFYGFSFVLLGIFLRFLDTRKDSWLLRRAVLFIFVIDLVRVGDISRETLSLTLWLLSIYAVQKVSNLLVRRNVAKA
jgi:hypothetical protein